MIPISAFQLIYSENYGNSSHFFKSFRLKIKWCHKSKMSAKLGIWWLLNGYGMFFSFIFRIFFVIKTGIFCRTSFLFTLNGDWNPRWLPWKRFFDDKLVNFWLFYVLLFFFWIVFKSVRTVHCAYTEKRFFFWNLPLFIYISFIVTPTLLIPICSKNLKI
jgi:hypothetical protein